MVAVGKERRACFRKIIRKYKTGFSLFKMRSEKEEGIKDKNHIFRFGIKIANRQIYSRNNRFVGGAVIN